MEKRVKETAIFHYASSNGANSELPSLYSMPVNSSTNAESHFWGSNYSLYQLGEARGDFIIARKLASLDLGTK